MYLFDKWQGCSSFVLIAVYEGREYVGRNIVEIRNVD